MMLNKGYSNITELLSEENANLLYKKIYSVYPAVKLEAGKVVKESLFEKGFSLTNVAAELEIDLGGFSRRLETGLALPYSSLTTLSYKFLRKSCNEVLLGFNMPTILPKDLSYILETMETYSDIKEEILLLIESMDYLDFKGKPFQNALFRERLEEYATDRGKHLRNVLGISGNHMNTSIRNLLTNENYLPDLKSLTFIAFRLHTSIDYFTSLDYTGNTYNLYNKLCLFDGTEIKSKKEIAFVSKYLRLSRKDKDLIFAKAIGMLFKAS